MGLSVNPTHHLPTTQSPAAAWIEWHRALRAAYGKATANTLFVQAWEKRGSSAANTTELRAYLEKAGVVIEGTTFSFVGDSWSSLQETFSFTSGLTRWLLIGVVIVVLLFLFNLARKPELVAATVKPSLV